MKRLLFNILFIDFLRIKMNDFMWFTPSEYNVLTALLIECISSLVIPVIWMTLKPVMHALVPHTIWICISSIPYNNNEAVQRSKVRERRFQCRRSIGPLVALYLIKHTRSLFVEHARAIISSKRSACKLCSTKCCGACVCLIAATEQHHTQIRSG